MGFCGWNEGLSSKLSIPPLPAWMLFWAPIPLQLSFLNQPLKFEWKLRTGAEIAHLHEWRSCPRRERDRERDIVSVCGTLCNSRDEGIGDVSSGGSSKFLASDVCYPFCFFIGLYCTWVLTIESHCNFRFFFFFLVAAAKYWLEACLRVILDKLIITFIDNLIIYILMSAFGN